METKTFEIRDRATFIPVVAVRLSALMHKRDHYLLRRSGFAPDDTAVLLWKLESDKGQVDPYDWGGCRTMGNAHKYIEEHWDELPSGSVVDVEFILGEALAPKESEQETAPELG